MEQIIVTIDPEAIVTVEVKGHSGLGCQNLTAALEQSLGETIKDVKTQEYHEPQRTRVRTTHHA